MSASSPNGSGHSVTELELHRVAGPDLTARQLHDLLRLRVDIFVVEQDCPYHEIDGLDLLADSEHLWFSDDAGITAALRILGDPLGRRIGRVVTRVDARGNQLSSKLMDRAHAVIDGDPGARGDIALGGQSHLRAFYERLGYEVSGDEYIEDGIPHFPMTRPIADRSDQT